MVDNYGKLRGPTETGRYCKRLGHLQVAGGLGLGRRRPGSGPKPAGCQPI